MYIPSSHRAFNLRFIRSYSLDGNHLPYTKYLSEVVQGMYLIFNGAMLLLNGRFYTALRRASFYSSLPHPEINLDDANKKIINT